MHLVYGTLIGRWYVTLSGLTFWRSSRFLGWRKTLLYAALAAAAEGGTDGRSASAPELSAPSGATR
jgi:hypothetical protein